jgi:hypothetical protein
MVFLESLHRISPKRSSFLNDKRHEKSRLSARTRIEPSDEEVRCNVS